MALNITEIKNGLDAAYQIAYHKASNWMGRGVVMWKSGLERGLPYLQDKRIAVISLIAINLIVIQMTIFFEPLLRRVMPQQTDRQKKIYEVVSIISGIGILIASNVGFVNYTKIPLRGEVITGITVATLLVYAFFIPDSKKKEKDEKEFPLD